MTSTSVDNLNTLTSSSQTTTKNPRLARAHPFLVKPTQIDSPQTDRNKFHSHSQASFHSFQLPPETIEQIHQQPSTTPRRSRVQWVQRYPSVHPSEILTSSLIDFTTAASIDQIQHDSSIHPNISITEMTTEDFTDEYGDFIEHVTPGQLEETITVVPIDVLSSDDDDDVDDQHATLIEEREPEQLSNTKITTDETPPGGSSKAKKKTKAEHPKKTKSGHKSNRSSRVSQQASSAHGSTPNGEGTSATPSPVKASTPSVVKTEETSAGKPLITIDTSRARSNIEVVRLCLRELSWKEVSRDSRHNKVIPMSCCSAHQALILKRISTGIRRRSMKLMAICLWPPAGWTNFLVSADDSIFHSIVIHV